MRPFLFGFVRGLTIPVYLLVGMVAGAHAGWRNGWATYKKDTRILRPRWVKEDAQ